MGYIYLIRNKVNDKKYIGKTVRNYERRWYELQKKVMLFKRQ